MPQTGRLNKVIELLEQGKVVFGGAVVVPGNIEQALAFSDVGYDFLIFEMEHEGFHLPNLRLSLQFLLDRKRIAPHAPLPPPSVTSPPVPPNARDHPPRVLKPSPDTGVYGLTAPHSDTVEPARA